jgi:hypothetical protein
MARFVLADLPVRAGMTSLPPWMPCIPLAIGAPYQLDIRFHRIQGDFPAPAILGERLLWLDNSKKRAAVNPAHFTGRRRQGTRPERMLAYTSPDSEPAIMGAVDDSHYSLVIAAAQAAGPCPVGEEAAWGRRVHGLTVDLHLIAQQARQDIERLESARTFIAFLEKVEIEESSRRGLLTLRLPSGESEPIRTEQLDTDRGREMIERARSLEGRWVLVYRYNERKTGQRNQSVRMLAHLMDLGGDGAVPSTAAKKMVLQEAGGDVARAQQAWTVAGLPGNGPVSVDQLEQARLAAREAG